MDYPTDNAFNAWVFPDTARGEEPLEADGSGHAEINSSTVKRDPQAVCALLVQSSAAITAVDVRGPNGAVWSPYPGNQAADANAVLIIHGCWTAVRITTSAAALVYVRGDRNNVWSTLGIAVPA